MQWDILDRWKEAFQLDDHELHRWVTVYPEIIDQNQENKELDAAYLVQKFMSQDRVVSTSMDAYNMYLRRGELAAARKTIGFITDEEIGPSIDDELTQNKNEWEERYHNLLSDVESLIVELLHLGTSNPIIKAWNDYKKDADLSMQNGRPGKALSSLEGLHNRLNEEMCLQVRQVEELITILEKQLNDDNLAEGNQQLEASRHLRLARDYLKIGELVLARNEVVLAQNAQEIVREFKASNNGEINSLNQRQNESNNVLTSSILVRNEAEGLYYRDPGDFPNEVKLEHVIRWMENGTLATYQQPQGWNDFLTGWADSELLTGETDEYLDDGDNNKAVLKTLKHLRKAQELSKSTENIKEKRHREVWQAFFRQFLRSMDLNTNAAPQYFQSLKNTRGLLFDKLGGRPGTQLSIQGSFINVARFPQGINLITWPDPRDYKPITAGPAMGQAGLDVKVGFIFTPVRVPQQIMNEFARHFPGWAIFDERRILKVLLAPPKERLIRFIVEAAKQINPESINPYSTQGPVQHEAMFFGRKSEIEKLMNPSGPAIVYGGRKLGKSSLLSQLVPRFESQSDGKHIALYMAIPQAGNTPGSVGDELSNILRHLANPLEERNWIVDPRNPNIRARNGIGFNRFLDPTKEPQQFFSQMHELLNKFQEHRFLFLLDEADAFLESQVESAKRSQLYDWEQNIGWQLRSLRHESQGRIDFIFAGFQGIARAARDPGGPFVNFRGTDPQPLSVLSEEDARELVARPLQYLGLRFERRSLIDRILYYTGRHPALLQQFCSELYLMKPENGVITSRHIEKIFLDRDFRKKIYEVINFNLVPIGLDRPKTILSLIIYIWIRYSYRNNIPGQSRQDNLILQKETVTAKEIYQRLQNYFPKQKVEKVLRYDEVESYLEDLRVLGVVEQGQHGYYIANRYFAQILKSEHDIDQEINKLWEQLNQISKTVGRRSINLQSGGRGLLPVTQDDESRLIDDNKVRLVFGSRGVGKSLLLSWLEDRIKNGSDKTQLLRINCQGMDNIEQVKQELARRLGCPQVCWEAIKILISESNKKYYLCFEDVDGLISPELIYDNELQNFLRPALRAKKSQNSTHLNILITGGMELARFWVEWIQVFDEIPLPVYVKRYSELDQHEWIKINSLHLSDDSLPRFIWENCQGDFRILNAFLGYLNTNEGRNVPGDFELNAEHFRRFTKQLLTKEAALWKEPLQVHVNGLDNKALSVLTWLVNCGQMYGETGISIELLELYTEEYGWPTGQQWSFEDLITEVKALAIIDELDTNLDQNESIIGRIRENDLWLKFILVNQAHQD
jgi:hypothetical protein